MPFEMLRPSEYYQAVEDVKTELTKRVIILIEGTSDLADLGENKPWPDDVICHQFRCTQCGRTFKLFADTYHGRASWRIVAP